MSLVILSRIVSNRNRFRLPSRSQRVPPRKAFTQKEFLRVVPVRPFICEGKTCFHIYPENILGYLLADIGCSKGRKLSFPRASFRKSGSFREKIRRQANIEALFYVKDFCLRYWPSSLKIEGYDSVYRINFQFNRGITRSRAKILNISLS